jgi:hypothetical protein
MAQRRRIQLWNRLFSAGGLLFLQPLVLGAVAGCCCFLFMLAEPVEMLAEIEVSAEISRVLAGWLPISGPPLRPQFHSLHLQSTMRLNGSIH